VEPADLPRSRHLIAQRRADLVGYSVHRAIRGKAEGATRSLDNDPVSSKAIFRLADSHQPRPWNAFDSRVALKEKGRTSRPAFFVDRVSHRAAR